MATSYTVREYEFLIGLLEDFPDPIGKLFLSQYIWDKLHDDPQFKGQRSQKVMRRYASLDSRLRACVIDAANHYKVAPEFGTTGGPDIEKLANSLRKKAGSQEEPQT